MAKKSYGKGGKDEDDETEAPETVETETPDEQPKTVKTKGSLSEKAVTVSVEKGEGIVAGMAASGAGLEYGTLVVRADGNSVVLDKPANETKADVDLTFTAF